MDESILPDIKRLTCLSNKDMARKLSKTITTMTKDKRICGKEITFLVPEVSFFFFNHLFKVVNPYVSVEIISYFFYWIGSWEYACPVS